jgi:hypothetical protein
MTPRLCDVEELQTRDNLAMTMGIPNGMSMGVNEMRENSTMKSSEELHCGNDDLGRGSGEPLVTFNRFNGDHQINCHQQ